MKLLPLSSPRLKLLFLTLMHFATDGLCSYLIFSKLYPRNLDYALFVFLGYNILAFVTQSPVGMLIDKHNKPKLFLAFSMAFMILGYAFGDFLILSVLFIGLGNSLFHVAGGKYVTDKSGNDISHLGIFVSTGAIGLVVGQRYLSLVFLPYILFAVFILCGLLVIVSEDSETRTYPEKYDDLKRVDIAIIIVLAVVFVRSFVGKAVAPGFTPHIHEFLLIGVATALGKAMGGIVSKGVGIRLTTYASMAVAAVCLTLGTGNIYMFILGVFAFNFSMPITLYFANILMKGKEGFAFGTLAATLAPGYFLAMLFSYSIDMRALVGIMCILSMLAIIIISKRINYADTSSANDNS